MQLKIRRSQRTGGILGNTAIFCVEARAEFTRQELSEIAKYKLGKQIVYNSKTFEKHAEALRNNKAADHDHPGMAIAGGALAMGKGVFHAVAAKMSLVITIDSLQRGQRIECKDMEEVLEAEEALDAACIAMRRYLTLAATFDGREILADYSTEVPTITVGQAPAPGSLPTMTTEVYEATPLITDGSGATAVGAMDAAPQSGWAQQVQNAPIEPGQLFTNFQYWFQSLTTAQKAGVIGGALFALYLIAQAF